MIKYYYSSYKRGLQHNFIISTMPNFGQLFYSKVSVVRSIIPLVNALMNNRTPNNYVGHRRTYRDTYVSYYGLRDLKKIGKTRGKKRTFVGRKKQKRCLQFWCTNVLSKCRSLTWLI